MKKKGDNKQFRRIENLVFSIHAAISEQHNLDPDSRLRSDQIDLLESRFHSLVAQLKGLQNSYQPVHRLPPELLVLIFQECQPQLPSFLPLPSTRQRSDLDCYKLASVCRTWRGIVATNPSLWRIIDTSHHPLTALKRAAGYNLTVYLGMRAGVISDRLVRELSGLMNRIQELHVDMTRWEYHPSAILSQLQAPAPELTSLSLYLRGDVDAGPMATLFAGQAPQLRKVSLALCTRPSIFNITIDDITPFFHRLPDTVNLTHLFLCDKASTSSFNLTDLVRLLERSPQLEELAIVDLCEFEFTEVSSIPTVVLKGLRSLDLGNTDSKTIATFFQYVHMPNATDVFIWFDYPGSLFSWRADISSILPSNLSALPWLSSVRTLTMSWYTRLHPGVHFIAVTRGGVYLNGLNGLCRGLDHYPFANIHTLTLEDGTQDLSDIEWRDLLSRMGSLRTLKILSWKFPRFARSILTALLPFDPIQGMRGRRSQSSRFDGFVAIHCPRLTEIYLEVEAAPPVLLLRSLAETRAERNAPITKLEVAVVRDVGGEGLIEPEQLQHEEEDVMALRPFIKRVLFNGDREGNPAHILPQAWPTPAYSWYYTWFAPSIFP